MIPNSYDLTIRPATKGRFTARLGERALGTFRLPFFESARLLLSEGASPDAPLTMRHEESPIVGMRGTVGDAASRTVVENEGDGPRFGRYQPYAPEAKAAA